MPALEVNRRRAELTLLLRAGLTESVSAETSSVDIAIEQTLTAATSPASRTLAPEAFGRLSGVLVATPERQSDAAFVLWIVVPPVGRRRGIGRALVWHLERSTTEAVCGLVNPDDPVAAGFGPAIGYPLPGTV
jgi:hypothetical protein